MIRYYIYIKEFLELKECVKYEVIIMLQDKKNNDNIIIITLLYKIILIYLYYFLIYSMTVNNYKL